jgi:serine/threonine protein kinase
MLPEERVERYELLGELASGGMATVYLGRQRGPFGFARTVAIKSMHPQFAKDEGFRTMFLDEATLTAKIRHPNVVQTLDVVCASTKLLLVMEYIEGVSLSHLLHKGLRTGTTMPVGVTVAIMEGVLHGLHAAHELTDEAGQHLAVVHRDVSPQNIHVGSDGLARVLDFGVAKAATHRYVTQTNEVKGKLAYMAPEQLCGEAVDRRTDIYAAGVVLWEALTGQRLHGARHEGEIIRRILEGKVDPPSFIADVPLTDAIDRVVMKALAPRADERWQTSEEMANALVQALAPAPRSEVSALVNELASLELTSRKHRLRESITGIKVDLEPEAQAVVEVLTAQATQASMTSAKRSSVAPGGSSSTGARQVATILGALVIVVFLTGTAFVVGSRTANRSSTGAPPSTGPTESPPQLSSSTLPTETPTGEPIPFAPPAPSLPVDAGSAPKAGGGKAKPHKAAVPRTSRPGLDCRVPYTVDANGDRHYKPECVE